eukprot:1159095-Pelagomonas_calceolata.AAC.12
MQRPTRARSQKAKFQRFDLRDLKGSRGQGALLRGKANMRAVAWSEGEAVLMFTVCSNTLMLCWHGQLYRPQHQPDACASAKHNSNKWSLLRKGREDTGAQGGSCMPLLEHKLKPRVQKQAGCASTMGGVYHVCQIPHLSSPCSSRALRNTLNYFLQMNSSQQSIHSASSDLLGAQGVGQAGPLLLQTLQLRCEPGEQRAVILVNGDGQQAQRFLREGQLTALVSQPPAVVLLAHKSPRLGCQEMCFRARELAPRGTLHFIWGLDRLSLGEHNKSRKERSDLSAAPFLCRPSSFRIRVSFYLETLLPLMEPSKGWGLGVSFGSSSWEAGEITPQRSLQETP